VSQAVGSQMMRAYLGGRAERTGPVPLEKHIDATVKVLRAVRSEALDVGVKIGIETHGDLQAWEVRGLIEEAGKDFVGATLDTGNPVTLAEDPMVTWRRWRPMLSPPMCATPWCSNTPAAPSCNGSL
jgi:3-oxoisoapionate decarboxylase